jgi:hypothetical protein
MFVLTTIGWVIFRATTLEQAFYMLTHVGIGTSSNTYDLALAFAGYCAPLVAMELYQYIGEKDVDLPFDSMPAQALAYAAAICIMMIFGARLASEFIYFQF